MYMPDKKIRKLLTKYLNGTATPDEIKLVDDWYDSISGDAKSTPLQDSERSQLRTQYWDRLKLGLHRPSDKHRSLWNGWTALAAAVSAIVVLVYFFVPSFLGSRSAGTLYQIAEASRFAKTVENTSDVARIITLSDNSRVTLFPGSVINIYENFNTNERKLQLSGRAFFEVARNESKPFYVLTHDIVTKVLGTSFNVSAFPDDSEITVAVTSGKVSVYQEAEKTDSPTGKIVLTPNEQAVYNKSDGKVSRTLVSVPRVVISEDEVKRIRFEGVSVSEIFKALEKMYGVDIEFDEESFDKCSMTTSVSRGDLFEKIDVICEITGASYSLEDARIRISGEGCN